MYLKHGYRNLGNVRIILMFHDQCPFLCLLPFLLFCYNFFPAHMCVCHYCYATLSSYIVCQYGRLHGDVSTYLCHGVYVATSFTNVPTQIVFPRPEGCLKLILISKPHSFFPCRVSFYMLAFCWSVALPIRLAVLQCHQEGHLLCSSAARAGAECSRQGYQDWVHICLHSK